MATAIATGRLLQGRKDLFVVRRQRGNEPGKESAEECHANREQDDHAVDMNGIRAGNVLPRMNEPAESDLGKHQTTCRACEGKDYALNDLFADEAGTAATEGGTDGGFSTPCRRAGDQEIRDIEAGNQQQTSSGGEQGVEAGFEMKDLSIEDRSNVG